MTFKEKLVNLRKIKGITQDEFAKAVGVSRQAVYKWESGQSYPEVTKLLEIKLLFGISIDDLLDETYEVRLPEKKKRRNKDTTKETLTPPTALDETISAHEVNKEAAPSPENTVDNTPVIETPSEKEIPVINDAQEKAEDKTEEKKVGFFGRLFGRR